ncbi:hypothetical protein JZ751_009827 [Albula glossodonta]|uniref:Uncharacterized protein n=1 Tax=Albula glossodonta TaxID=121402 RepID=A0A8T2P1P3_9TELE|nr:hypothetical protein JZ751_009827 [Albula glossodonta]
MEASIRVPLEADDQSRDGSVGPDLPIAAESNAITVRPNGESRTKKVPVTQLGTFWPGNTCSLKPVSSSFIKGWQWAANRLVRSYREQQEVMQLSATMLFSTIFYPQGQDIVAGLSFEWNLPPTDSLQCFTEPMMGPPSQAHVHCLPLSLGVGSVECSEGMEELQGGVPQERGYIYIPTLGGCSSNAQLVSGLKLECTPCTLCQARELALLGTLKTR